MKVGAGQLVTRHHHLETIALAGGIRRLGFVGSRVGRFIVGRRRRGSRPLVCVVAKHHHRVFVEPFTAVSRVVALQHPLVAAVRSVHALHPHPGADGPVVLLLPQLVHSLRAVGALVKSCRACCLVLPVPSQRHGLTAVLTNGALVPAYLLVRQHLGPGQGHSAGTCAFILETVDESAGYDLVETLLEVILDASSGAHPLAPRPVGARERAILAESRV